MPTLLAFSLAYLTVSVCLTLVLDVASRAAFELSLADNLRSKVLLGEGIRISDFDAYSVAFLMVALLWVPVIAALIVDFLLGLVGLGGKSTYSLVSLFEGTADSILNKLRDNN